MVNWKKEGKVRLKHISGGELNIVSFIRKPDIFPKGEITGEKRIGFSEAESVFKIIEYMCEGAPVRESEPDNHTYGAAESEIILREVPQPGT